MVKPILVILHNDLDGGVSGICIVNYIKQKYGNNQPYSLWFGNYTNVDSAVERFMDDPDKYEEIIIADISVKPDLAKEFHPNMRLLDHHDSATLLNGIPGCIVDTSGNHCGATMCYRYLLKDLGYQFKHLSKLCAIAIDYDLWHLRLPNNLAKNLNFLYYKYWGEKFVERFMNGFDGFNEEEKTFLQQKWKDIEEDLATTDFVDVLGVKNPNKMCLIVKQNNKGEINELCEHALNVKKFHVVVSILPKKQKMSIRISDHAVSKGLHIGRFNVELGIGGGHEKAGGASYTDNNHLESICEKLADRIINLDI